MILLRTKERTPTSIMGAGACLIRKVDEHLGGVHQTLLAAGHGCFTRTNRIASATGNYYNVCRICTTREK